MNKDTENFEQLRRLLVLKRYEQPPPRYFNDFSSQVIARIRHGGPGEEGALLERLFWEAPWVQRIWTAIEAKPILAGVFGVAVSGLLITGVIYSDRADKLPPGLDPVAESASAPMSLANASAEDHPLLAKPAGMIEASSTNPVASAEGSILDDFRRLRAQPASFGFPSGN